MDDRKAIAQLWAAGKVAVAVVVVAGVGAAEAVMDAVEVASMDPNQDEEHDVREVAVCHDVREVAVGHPSWTVEVPVVVDK